MNNSNSLLFFLAILVLVSTVSVDAETYVQPTSFYKVEEETDIPPVNPLGIIKDNQGNIHSWFFYIEPTLLIQNAFVSVYYNILFSNGTNIVDRIARESILQTKFYFLQKLELVSINGTTYGIFIQTSDFGTELIQFGWSNNDGKIFRSLDIPSDIEFQGDILGPRMEGSQIRYFLPGLNSTQHPVIHQISFAGGNYQGYTQGEYPVFATQTGQGQLSQIFDIDIHNGSTYYLASQTNTTEYHHLVVVSHNGTEYNVLHSYQVNALPTAEIPLLNGILAEIIKPQLEITSSGELYSHLFSLSEELQLNLLTKWYNGTGINPLVNETVNPFITSFFPVIKAVDNEIRISSLGFQFAQDIISLSLDRFTFNTNNGTLVVDKSQDISYSSGLFFAAMDLTSDKILAIVSTFSTPDFIVENYNVANTTVGTTYIVSNEPIPITVPVGLNVGFNSDIETTDQRPTYRVFIVLAITAIAIIGIGTILWRRQQLQLPEIVVKKAGGSRQKFSSKISTQFVLHRIFLKTNYKRIGMSSLILLIPALLIMSLFLGALSHQENLLIAYEQQNPLNDDNDLSASAGDFIWERYLYDDERANNVLTEIEWLIPLQLSKTTLDKYDIGSTDGKLSSVTMFPLFEKRNVTFVNDDNETETVTYPVNRDIAVVEPSWNDYLSERLIRGRMPVASNELLIQESWFVPPDGFNLEYPYGRLWDVNTKLNLHASELDIYLNTSIPGLSQEFTIVGVIGKVDSFSFPETQEWADKLGTTVALLRSLDKVPFYTSGNIITDAINAFSRVSLRLFSYIDIRYTINDLERDKLPIIIDNYKRMSVPVLQETGFPWVGTFNDKRIVPFLEGYFESTRNVQLEGTIIIVPVIGLTLFLTIEALGIGKTSLQEELERYKREGVRFENLLSFIVLERLVTSFISLGIALVVLKPTTRQLLRFTGYFKKSNDIIPLVSDFYIIIIAGITFLLLFLIGVVLSLKYYVNLKTWRYRRYFGGMKNDIVMIIFAFFVLWVGSSLNNLFQDQINMDPNETSLDSTTELVVLTLRLISLMIMSLAVLIIASKLINRIMLLVSKGIWKTHQSRLTLIFNGIGSNIGIYSKGLLIFAIAFFLLVPMIVVPATLDGQYTELAYEELGTDINVLDWHEVDNVTKYGLAEIKGVEISSQYFFGTIQFSNGISFQTFALDPKTFRQAIIVPESYREDLGFELSIIENLQANEVLTSIEVLKRNPLRVGGSFTLTYPHLSAVNSTFYVKGSYFEFPVLNHLITTDENADTIPLQMVISLETLKTIQSIFETNATDSTNFTAQSLSSRNLIVKLTSSGYMENVVSYLRGTAGVQLEQFDTYYRQQQHSFYRLYEFVTHITLVVSLLAPVLITIILTNVMFTRRKAELEVYRRNGVSYTLFVLQLLIEFVISIILPVLPSILVGTWWTETYGLELFGEDPSDLTWIVNNALIFGIIGLTLVISSIIFLVQLRWLAKRYVNQVRL